MFVVAYTPFPNLEDFTSTKFFMDGQQFYNRKITNHIPYLHHLYKIFEQKKSTSVEKCFLLNHQVRQPLHIDAF